MDGNFNVTYLSAYRSFDILSLIIGYSHIKICHLSYCLISQNWKRKAKRFNARGPNIISTGKTGKTSTLTKSGQSKPTAEAAPSVQPASGKVTSPPAEKVVKASSSVDSTTKVDKIFKICIEKKILQSH